AAPRVILARGRRRYGDDVEVGRAVSWSGDSAADQRSHDSKGGAQREHAVGPTCRASDPVDNIANGARQMRQRLKRVRPRRLFFGFRGLPVPSVPSVPSGLIVAIAAGKLDIDLGFPVQLLGQKREGSFQVATERGHDQVERRVSSISTEVTDASGADL